MSKPARAERAATAPAAAPTPASPARQALDQALRTLRDAERRATAARAPAARLEAEMARAAAALDRLTALDADYAARMADWADGGAGDAPTPDLEGRREAQAAANAATLKAEAARSALAGVNAAIAAADADVGAARENIRPAVAGMLREEGRWIVAEYWRRYAELEQVRRELAALDQILLTDFPITHAPTGRTIVDWISPDKLPPQATLKAIDDACANLEGVRDLTQYWRAKAAELAR